ncbi:MAG TPA: antitoxin family protein [Thermoanaerobaculia bacterium]|jgi:predicted DNA-binding antitoxin AbrB/MazE fold protein|nr:antitoxin family protein [Thermoanaerobaculia bacterium]
MIVLAGGMNAMTKILEAVYEDGVLKPLRDPGLTEHQRVVVEIRLPSESAADSELEDWRRVYDGLSDSEIAEVEVIALDRSRFSREP